MNKIISIIFRLLLGFICCAFGTVMALQSNLGLSPWDIFHQGLSNITGLTIGQVSVIVGVIVVTITVLLKLEIGLGTIGNMIIIVFFIELSVLVVGWMLGGHFGIGTLITVMTIGYCVQLVFKIFKFDVKKVRHKNIKESFVFLNKYINNKEGHKNGI